MDQTDLKILDALQRDGTLSSSQLAETIGMTQSPTWRRIMALEQNGIIKGRVALIDRDAVGLELMVFVLVKLKDQTEATVSDFTAAVSGIAEVVQCHMLMGDIDFLLLVVTTNMNAYHSLLRRELSKLPGIIGIDSRVVVEESKNTTCLPLAILNDP